MRQSFREHFRDMSLGLLENSPKAGHLLVQLHDRHRLYELAKNTDPMARAELATIMTELLDMELSLAEQEIITDVLMGVIRKAEIDLRQALAQRIAALADAPLRMVLHLANDEISVAEPILRKSRALTDMDLIYIVKAKGAEYWRAIAKRPQMNAQLINTLAQTKDLDTAVNLVENKYITLTPEAAGLLAEMAQKAEGVARPLVMREDLSQDVIESLYRFVGKELKAYIRENYEGLSQSVLEDVSDVVDEIVEEFITAQAQDDMPSPDMVVAAEALLSAKNLNPDVMVQALRRGHIAEFVAQFSVYCGLPAETVASMLAQKTAQGLAVACKAVGIEKPQFVNIFLLTARLRCDGLIDHNDLSQALSYFDRIKVDVAQKILSQSRH